MYLKITEISAEKLRLKCCERISPFTFLTFLFVSTFFYLINRLKLPTDVLGFNSWLNVICRGAVICFSIFFLSQQGALSRKSFFFSLFLLAILAHFPGNLLFHYDEWDVLFRYQTEGALSALTPHGEHFIPLFLLPYFLEIEIFCFSYPALLLFSALLLATNAFILEVFLKELRLLKNIDKRAIRFVCYLYLINSMQVEVSQWAFMQCLLIQNILTLLAALLAIFWVKNRSVSALGGSLFCVFTADFMQATGFITPLFCLIALIFEFFNKEEKRGFFCLVDRSSLLRIFDFTVLCGIVTFIASLAYAAFIPAKESLDLWALMQGVSSKIIFFFYGVFAVTFMRGLSFFPSLELNDELAASYATFFNLLVRPIISNTHVFLILAGVVVFLLIFVILFADKKNRNPNLLLAVFGLLTIAIFFLPPSLGRVEFGLGASIHQRYQTRMLIGLCLIFAPIIARYVFAKAIITKSVSIFIISVHTIVQLKMESDFRHFIDYSKNTKRLICNVNSMEDKVLNREIRKVITTNWQMDAENFKRVLNSYKFSCT